MRITEHWHDASMAGRVAMEQDPCVFPQPEKSESQLARSLSEISERAVDLSAISVERRFLFSLLVDQALGPVLTGAQA